MTKAIRTSSWMLILASFVFIIYSCAKEEMNISSQEVDATELRLFQMDQPDLVSVGKIAHLDDIEIVQDLIDRGKLTNDLIKASSSTIDRSSDEHQYLIVRGENGLKEHLSVAYPIKIQSDGTVKLLVALPAPSCTGQSTCQDCDFVKKNKVIVGCDCKSANGWCKYKNCKEKNGIKLCCTSMEQCEKCDFTTDSSGALDACNCTTTGTSNGWCQPKLTTTTMVPQQN